MRLENVSILSLATLDAPHRVESAELDRQIDPILKRLGLPPSVVGALTGIVARRFWDPGTQPSEVATRAGKLAIEHADVDPEKVDLLISTSVCKDYIEPSVASLVHGNLRLGAHCLNFDVGNACLAFMNGMEIAGRMIERGDVRYALIVDGEGSRFITEQTIQRMLTTETDASTFWKNFASLTLGSGAAAMLLGRSDTAGEGHQLTGGVSLAATQFNQLCRGQIDRMETDATGLLVAGVELANQTYARAQKELGWKVHRPDEYVLHQVSGVHTDKLVQSLGLPEDRVHRIYPEFGNCGPAGIPITLSKARDANRLRPGKRVALMGIGSGLNCAMMEVIW
jgi:3-oxoacyl-[acyl-carrier-protein] synthase III